MTDSKVKLSNGVEVGSIVAANYFGVKRYGKVMEIDNKSDSRSMGKETVLVQHFNGEPAPASKWYHAWDLQIITPEIYERQHQQLTAELDELNRAGLAAKLAAVKLIEAEGSDRA